MELLQANLSISEMPLYSNLLFVDNVPKKREKKDSRRFQTLLHGCSNLDFCSKVCVVISYFGISVDPSCLVAMLRIAKGGLNVYS